MHLAFRKIIRNAFVTNEAESVEPALVLLEVELCVFTYYDFARDSSLQDLVCGDHCRSKNIIPDRLRPDNSSNDVACVHSYSKLKVFNLFVFFFHLINSLYHFKSCLYNLVAFVYSFKEPAFCTINSP